MMSVSRRTLLEMGAGHQLARWVPQLGRGAQPWRARWLGGRPGPEKLLARTSSMSDSSDEWDAELQLTHCRCDGQVSSGLLSSAKDCRRHAICVNGSHTLPADLRCVSVIAT